MSKKLKLTKLSRKEVEKVKGGGVDVYGPCGCGCAYADCGGSSTTDNAYANSLEGLSTPPGAGCKK